MKQTVNLSNRAAKEIGFLYSGFLKGDFDCVKKVVRKFREYVNNGVDEKCLKESIKKAYEESEYTDISKEVNFLNVK